MAMRILTSGRSISANLPLRVCGASGASMSTSSSTPEVPKNKKRESILSAVSSIFGGKVEPANPKDGPIPANKINFPDVTEKATGEQKLLLLAFENGFIDPYCNLPAERAGRGTKDNPVKVESFGSERMVACVCEETQNYVKYTILYKNEPKRCACGHWMELVEGPRFWEKIPKDDLLTIPYFAELEAEGKLDKFLAGKLELEAEHGHGHH